MGDVKSYRASGGFDQYLYRQVGDTITASNGVQGKVINVDSFTEVKQNLINRHAEMIDRISKGARNLQNIAQQYSNRQVQTPKAATDSGVKYRDIIGKMSEAANGLRRVLDYMRQSGTEALNLSTHLKRDNAPATTIPAPASPIADNYGRIPNNPNVQRFYSYLDGIASGQTEQRQRERRQKLDTWSKSLSADDIVRIGTIGLDLGSIPAAQIPGYGTVASGVMGIASTATNFALDSRNPNVSLTEALSNFAKSFAGDVAGVVPGYGVWSKESKIVTKYRSLFPLLLDGFIAAGVTDGLESVKKAMESPQTMTLQDWKNISSATQVLIQELSR